MNLKKILAAIAACAMATSMLAMTAFAAGVEAGDETLEEEVVTEEEVVEEEEVEEEVEVEETPEVSNPTTGNSPIALAVIPVALAAAAVVAKKAK